jgi:hypothetical protein
MPVHWKIDPDWRLMTVQAEGLVTREEFEAMLDAMVEAGAIGYAKLFDGRGADTKMSVADLMGIGVRIKALHASRAPHPVGPLAIVLDGDKFGLVARVLGILATAKRPMRVFDEIVPAQEWIDKQRAYVAA